MWCFYQESNIAECVCTRTCLFLCVRVERRRKRSQKGECFWKSQAMYHLHTAGCMSDTGLLLRGTIALLLNGSHIKASDPESDARQQGKEEGWGDKQVRLPGHCVMMCSCDGTDLKVGSANFFKIKRQKIGFIYFFSLSFSSNLSILFSHPPPLLAQHLTEGAARGQLFFYILGSCVLRNANPYQVLLWGLNFLFDIKLF